MSLEAESQPLASFEGYAVVEIMGHQRVSGHVTTQYFGSTAVFRVVQQEQPAIEKVLEKDEWIDGERIYAGSRVRLSRKRAETFVAAASLYRLTPCSEDEANRSQPVQVEILERAERKMIEVGSKPEDEYDAEAHHWNERDDDEL